MSLPPPPPATESKPRGRGAAAFLGVLAAVVALVWAWVILRCTSLASDVDDVSGNPFVDASAVQISQVANEATVQQLAALSVGAGASAVFVAVTLVVIATRQR